MRVGQAVYNSSLGFLAQGAVAALAANQAAITKEQVINAATPRDDAVRVTLSSDTFRMKLERHLDDFHKGRGHLSGEVSVELDRKNSEVSDYLARTDPKLLKEYAGLVSGLDYDRKARFVSAIRDASHAVQYLQSEREVMDFQALLLERSSGEVMPLPQSSTLQV